MDLTEREAKDLFASYGIARPAYQVISLRHRRCRLPVPYVLKSQVHRGDRLRKGGIVFVDREREFAGAKKRLLATAIDGERPQELLAEERVAFEREYYVSFSFDTATRTPVLALSGKGGTGIARAALYPLDVLGVQSEYVIRQALSEAKLPLDRQLIAAVMALWKLFMRERVLLAEINPLFALADGRYVAGDAKVTLDDAIARPGHRPYVQLEGDIAVLASGGGASMVNLDALMRAGGRPANYVEYSGNPKGDVVSGLTQRVLGPSGLAGCWVVGGTANFTDIYETMRGFVAGLRKVRPRPTYPIVVRRDGPRRAEAFAYLETVRERDGFDLHVMGPETSMAESAKLITQLAYQKTR